jgi:hypothetical protein
MGLFDKLIGNAGVVDNAKLTEQYGDILIDGEDIQIGFKLVRDVSIFTNKRLILIDIHGVTGKKKEYKSVIYKAISRFSIEGAGNFDRDAEIKIWVSSESNPSIQMQVDRSVNAKELQRVLATNVL